jgi:hypothetical protein
MIAGGKCQYIIDDGPFLLAHAAPSVWCQDFLDSAFLKMMIALIHRRQDGSKRLPVWGILWEVDLRNKKIGYPWARNRLIYLW